MSEHHTPSVPVRNEGRYASGVQALFRSLRLAFAGLICVIVGMLVYFVCFDSAFQVQPHEEVIVMRFGRYVNSYSSGWQWFLPYPVTSYVKVPVMSKTLTVNFNPAQQNTQAPPNPEQPLIPGRDNYLLTADANIVHTSWALKYKITDAYLYYSTVLTPQNPMDSDELQRDAQGNPAGRRGPETLLSNLVRFAVIEVTAGMTAHQVLYSEQALYIDRVRMRVNELLGTMKFGVVVEDLLLQQSNVPLAVKPAFDMAQAAGAAQETLVSQAEDYRMNVENATQTQAENLKNNARNYRKQVVEMIAADVKYFQEILAAYEKNPEATLIPLYYDAVGTLVGQANERYLLGPGTEKKVWLRLNPEPKQAEEQNSNTEVRR